MSNQPLLSTTYILDTNLFRYYTHKSNDINVKKNRKAAIDFWNKIIEESTNQEADVLIPLEVKNELLVQKNNFSDVVNQKIDLLLNHFDIDDYVLPPDIELQLRVLSSYVVGNYRDVIQPAEMNGSEPYKVTYLQASDARILASAYMNDGILVTRNIKDFVIYLFLCPAGAKCLYDFVEKQYITIPQEGMDKVLQDTKFQEMKRNIESALLL
ncbi:DUF4411 family protein [Paenibacillus sp. PsM32]|uniref:DUF4411 family protein n=1 Tax=Paenibacillus sp. PsM32 TaxID=3030536 RepID=UPI00263B65EB|nr:DUF4411 family protein [Paenibacillus sp. PsM32]MDN4619119.1 DUF4411 family protein [Paenibacillus sp. PsM32]